MALSDERIIDLLKKRLEGTISEEEVTELMAWGDENPKLFHELGDRQALFAEAIRFSKTKKEVFIKLRAQIPELNEEKTSTARIVYWRKYAAAGILVMGGLIAYLLTHSPISKESKKSSNPSTEIAMDIPAPAGHKTVLKLSGGSLIDLDSAANGALGRQGNSDVTKFASGELNYKALHEKPTETVFNTVFVKRGGEYQVVLADGSKVWLNSESSLIFPTVFTSKERVVELTGEGYFEIAKNSAMPFRVKIPDGSTVEVLGTHFNIKAYSNEPRAITTLLEGSVKLSSGGNSKLLRPGQQGYILNAGNIEIKEGDVQTATAWRDGLFLFKSTDIGTVMRSLARWYDVDVKFEGQPSGNLLTAQVKKSHSASDVLKVLEISGYHFRIGDRKIIVMP